MYDRDATDRVIVRATTTRVGSSTLRYAFTGDGDTADVVLNKENRVLTRTVALPGGWGADRPLSTAGDGPGTGVRWPGRSTATELGYRSATDTRGGRRLRENDDMPDEDVITVAVVEDHPLYADALVRLVQGDAGLRVVSASASIAELEAVERTARADVVLLDLNLPGLSGVAGVRRLVEARRVILVLSAAARPDTVAEVIAAGARGYLTKSAGGTEVVAAVRTLAAGGRHVPEGLPPVPEAPTSHLTQREMEVLARLAAGETDAEIASSLVISVRTVSSHLDRIREKTGRRRRPDLTRLAYEAGIVGPARGHG